MRSLTSAVRPVAAAPGPVAPGDYGRVVQQ